MASVLESTPPRFTTVDVAALAAELFGVGGNARDLGSERDQTFLVEGAGVVKISNAAEDPANLDLEAAAIEHALRADPDLPIARQLRGQQLESHLPAEASVFGTVDHAHAAAAELFDDAVVRQDLADQLSEVYPRVRRLRTAGGAGKPTAFCVDLACPGLEYSWSGRPSWRTWDWVRFSRCGDISSTSTGTCA